MPFDVAIIGAGLSGFATALLLQARGARTVIFDAHTQPGGCCGFWKTQGFSFDVGATTFVDFAEHGVGGRFLREVGVTVPGEALAGYRVHLPDRELTLWRDRPRWHRERSRVLGDTERHRAFWTLLDRINDVFWEVTRTGSIELPIRRPAQLTAALRALSPRDWSLARYLRWTMADALRAHGLRGDRALCTVLGMLLEDTVHSDVDAAPLINGAMGINIRGAGLTRFEGGARGLWKALIRRYRELGGELRLGTAVHRVDPGFAIHSSGGVEQAGTVVSSVPAEVTARLAPFCAPTLHPWVRRDRPHRGGAVLVMLGVPEHEVPGAITHHGLFQDYDAPFGEGNNMFVSVSSAGDKASAPEGWRSVMISTHCELAPWQGLDAAAYEAKKSAIGGKLVALARRVYPKLGREARIYEVATPRTYERFTGRPQGAVGGVRQRLDNTNLHAVPHDIGIPGFRVVGDTTWPGLGTVSCLVGAAAVVRSLG